MISVKNLHIDYGDFKLSNINFDVADGQYAVFMGKTGSGKTSIMESICGLRPIQSGCIELCGRDVTQLPPADRGIGFVPQDLALFPTMNVYDQIAFSLRIRKWADDDIDKRVKELATWLGVDHLFDRDIKGLSGGERQRVAMGRALAFKPGVLCLDEPLSALDDDTREEMYKLFGRLRSERTVTVFHITHNLNETKSLADQLLVLEKGQVIKEVLRAN